MTIGQLAKYPRLSLFQNLMRPFSDWSRTRRMRRFMGAIQVREGMSIIDLGGQPMIWENIPLRLDITILNLDGIAIKQASSSHLIRYAVGDACNALAYLDQSFDFVFSNSVIEHVGDTSKRSDFAREVRRLGKGYWVQTPSKWFPIEAHSGMPLWWFYPDRLRTALTKLWRKKLPDWTRMIEETDVVSSSELRRLFPEATILVERFLGIPKSYIAVYRRSPRRV